MHEPVLKNVFGDDRHSLGLSHQRHVLCLHVCGEARKFERNDIGCPKIAIAVKRYAIRFRLDVHTSLAERFNDASEVERIRIEQLEVTIRYCARNEKCS